MSRSGYTDDTDDIDNWALIKWRGAVASAMRGKRGQAFLREMLAALDALPNKLLIADDLFSPMDGEVCALGSVGKARGIDMSALDPHDHMLVAEAFGIPHALACEIMEANDDHYIAETCEARFTRMRRWIETKLIEWEGE